MKSVADIFRSWAVLDSQGRHTNGTDKESNHHYGDAYEWILTKHNYPVLPNSHAESMRDKVTHMMEVGVADGSSLCAWSEIFPNAICVGLDIHPITKRTNNVEFHLGNQLNKVDCDRAAAGRQFDFICEDATHYLVNTLVTLFYLWPYVKPGGLYVVEEWSNIHGDKDCIKALFPMAEIVDTVGPSGGTEPLVVFRKPL